MAGEIQLSYGTTGHTLYAVDRNDVAQIWNQNSTVFEAYNAANWADYAIPMSEQGASGYYAGDMPLHVAGVYLIEVRRRVGGSPAVTDPVVGGGDIQWSDTTTVVQLNDLLTLLENVQSDTNDIQNRLPAALVSGRIDASVGGYQSGLTPLQPTTAGRTLDVTATGAAGVDWANVENQSATVELSETVVNSAIGVGTVFGLGPDVITAASLASDVGAEIGTAVWATATRVLTAGTNIVLAKGVGVTGFTDLSAAQVNAEVDTALADVGVTPTVTGRIDAAITSRPTLAQILAGGDVDGYTLEQTLKLCLAALAGKLSGAATTTVTIRAADDSKDRIVATVDSNGNRSSVTLDATG